MPTIPRTRTLAVSLSSDELALIASALDSHVYWQLSDPEYRNNGGVSDPGSADPESADEIRQCEVLMTRLDVALAVERPSTRRARRS